jgi:hypothetical protein
MMRRLLGLLCALVLLVACEIPVDDPPTTTSAAPTTTTEGPTTTTQEPTTTTAAPTTTTEPPAPAGWIVGTVQGPCPLSDPDCDTLQAPLVENDSFDPDDYLEPRSIPGSTAHWPVGNMRTLCTPSHLGHDDPIVYPGQTDASHLHMFFGPTDLDADSTYESLRQAEASTCRGGPLNNTGYWIPAMFDGNANVRVPSLILLYYKAIDAGGTLAEKQESIRNTTQLPRGLRMVADDMQWKCADGTTKAGGDLIPDDCPDNYLIGVVDFPQCWDGVHLDSPTHRAEPDPFSLQPGPNGDYPDRVSHVAYREHVNGRHLCPPSHPYRLTWITEQFHWSNTGNTEGTWYLSSDVAGMLEPAPRGSTFHADWFGAWDPEIQQRWHDACNVEMRDGDNSDLCDGQGLTPGDRGVLSGGQIVPGWTPTAP